MWYISSLKGVSDTRILEGMPILRNSFFSEKKSPKPTNIFHIDALRLLIGPMPMQIPLMGSEQHVSSFCKVNCELRLFGYPPYLKYPTLEQQISVHICQRKFQGIIWFFLLVYYALSSNYTQNITPAAPVMLSLALKRSQNYTIFFSS